MKRNPAMSWSSLISCRWTFQRLPKMDSQKTLKPSFASWLKDLSAYDKTLTDAQLSHFFNFDCCTYFMKKGVFWLVKCPGILWLADIDIQLMRPRDDDRFSPPESPRYSWYSRNPVHYAELCLSDHYGRVRLSECHPPSHDQSPDTGSHSSLSHSLCPSHVQSW